MRYVACYQILENKGYATYSTTLVPPSSLLHMARAIVQTLGFTLGTFAPLEKYPTRLRWACQEKLYEILKTFVRVSALASCQNFPTPESYA